MLIIDTAKKKKHNKKQHQSEQKHTKINAHPPRDGQKMENSYGIGVTNRYAMLFNMDDEPASGAAPPAGGVAAVGATAAKKQAKPAKKPAATSAAAGTLKPANTNQSAHPPATNNKGTNQEKENKVSQTANNKSDATGKVSAAKNRSGGPAAAKDSQTQRNTMDRPNRDGEYQPHTVPLSGFSGVDPPST